METSYLKYAFEVYECGSINKAAQHLNMSQPNLSVCIKNLENELGYTIFERSHNGMRLTGEGRMFLKSAEVILHEMKVINEIPSRFKIKDNLSLSCTYSFDVMNTFVKFKKKNPPSNYEDLFKETGAIQVARDLIEKRYRMAFFYCFDDVIQKYYDMADKYNFKIIPIVERCPLILLVSKKNPLSKETQIDFERIKTLKFIMFENFRFDEWLKKLGFENDRQILYVYDRGGLIDFIKQSNYVTVMMKRFTEEYSSDCVEIPIVNSPIKMNAYLMYDKEYIPNYREKDFIKALKKRFEEY